MKKPEKVFSSFFFIKSKRYLSLIKEVKEDFHKNKLETNKARNKNDKKNKKGRYNG